MQSKKVKKMFTATLAAALLLGSTLTVGATSSGNSADTTSGNSAATASSSSTSSSESTPVYWGTVTYSSSNGNVTVAGKAVKTTIAGSINVQKLQGLAVITPLDQVSASLGLTAGQTPHITAYDINAKTSNLAFDCINSAANSLGAEVVASINVLLNARENGKIVNLTDGSASIVVGLPKNADLSKTYSVVRVQPGGVITFLKDQDASADTVTFDVSAGISAYAIVAK